MKYIELALGDVVKYPEGNFEGSVLAISYDGRYLIVWDDGSTGWCFRDKLEFVRSEENDE